VNEANYDAVFDAIKSSGGLRLRVHVSRKI